jgi:hypothetical protein
MIHSTGGKYGFAEQIIDGMCVSINSVIVNFRAKDFAASIQVLFASYFAGEIILNTVSFFLHRCRVYVVQLCICIGHVISIILSCFTE